MRFQPLDSLVKDNYISDGWDVKTMADFWNFCNKPTLTWLFNLLRKYAQKSQIIK